MNLKQLISCIALLTGVVAVQNAHGAFPTSEAIKSIPRPTLGKRWTLIEELSDEFNGTKLDTKKWYDYHPSWRGRPPGLFMSEQVSVKDGCLVLEGGKLEAGESVTVKSGYEGKEKEHTYTAIDKFVEGDSGYNVKCAAVVAKSITAHYDTYYECRVNANQTILSTTFWLSQHGKQANTADGRQAEGWNGTYGQELDILECIGRSGDFAGNNFSKGMHSNAHLWFKESGTNKTMDFRAKSVTLERADKASPSADFNIYGCWWVDKSQAIFYLNNEISESMDFKVKTAPKGQDQHKDRDFFFSEPLGLNLVMETYTWFYETPAGKNGWNDRLKNDDGTYKLVLPTDEELCDPSKNKSYYDWVRCYKLKDINEKVASKVAYEMFENRIHLYEKPATCVLKDNKFSLKLEYTAVNDCEIEFAIYDANKRLLSTHVVSALAGYANNSYTLDVKRSKQSENREYYVVASLRPANSKNNSYVYETDSFVFNISNN